MVDIVFECTIIEGKHNNMLVTTTGNNEIWIDKAQVRKITPTDHDSHMITIPDWLARRKNLI